VVDDRAGSWRLEDLIPKTLSLLHEWVPRAKRIDMVNQANDPGHAVFAKVMLDAARLRGLGCKVFQVRDEGELVTTIAGSTADALLMIATQMIYARPGRIAATAVGTKPAACKYGWACTRPDRKWHPVLLLPQPARALQSRGRLRRPHPAWRQGGRHSGGAAVAL
jgi:hypothetical protein